MTYAEFKAQMTTMGVRDDDVIGFIEIEPDPGETDLLIERRIAPGGEAVVNVFDRFD